MQKRTLISYSKNSCVNVNVCVVCWQVIQELGGGLRGDREVGGGEERCHQDFFYLNDSMIYDLKRSVDLK